MTTAEATQGIVKRLVELGAKEADYYLHDLCPVVDDTDTNVYPVTRQMWHLLRETFRRGFHKGAAVGFREGVDIAFDSKEGE